MTLKRLGGILVALLLLPLQARAQAATEAALALATELEGWIGAQVGSISRSALTEGDGWQLFGFGGNPGDLSTEEIRKQLRNPEEARRQNQKSIDTARSDSGLQREALEILPKMLPPEEFKKLIVGRFGYEIALENLATTSAKAVLPGNGSDRWRYEFIAPNTDLKTLSARPSIVIKKDWPRAANQTPGPFGAAPDKGPDRWLVVEWADPRCPLASITDSNVILLSSTSGLPKLKLSHFRQIHEDFLDDFNFKREDGRWSLGPPIPPPEHFIPPPAIMYTAVHNPDGSEFLTRFVASSSSNTGSLRQLVGEARLVSADPQRQSRLLAKELSELPKGTHICFYGDDLRSIDINRIADGAGVDALRRSPKARKPLRETQERLVQLTSRSLEDAATAFVNGTPADAYSVKSLGPFVASSQAWLDLHEAVELAANNRFTHRLQNKDAFLQELQSGENDVVYVIAHSDGLYLYLGAERLSLTDLTKLPKRTDRSSRPRVAVLAVCNSGKIAESSRSRIDTLFRQQTLSLAEVLLERGFFDQVIAPDHLIEGPEAIAAVVGELHLHPLAGIRGVFRNWNKLVLLIGHSITEVSAGE